MAELQFLRSEKSVFIAKCRICREYDCGDDNDWRQRMAAIRLQARAICRDAVFLVAPSLPVNDDDNDGGFTTTKQEIVVTVVVLQRTRGSCSVRVH